MGVIANMMPQVLNGTSMSDTITNSAKNYVGLKEAFRTSRLNDEAEVNTAKLKSAFANADTSTELGQADLIKQLYMIDPNAAAAQQKVFAEQKKSNADLALKASQVKDHLAKADETTFKTYTEHQTQIGDALSRIQRLADDPKVPKEQVQRSYIEEVKRLHDSGVFTDRELAGLPPEYNADFVKKAASTNKSYMEAIKTEADARSKAATEKKADADTSFRKVQEQTTGKQEVQIMVGGKPHIGVLDKATNKVIDTGVEAVPKGSAASTGTSVPEGVDPDKFERVKAEFLKAYGPQYTRMSKTAQAELDNNIARLMKDNPDMTAKQVADSVVKGSLETKKETNRATAEGRVGGTAEAKVSMAIKELEGTIPIAKKAMAALSRTGFTPLNSIIRKTASTWSPEEKAAQAANESVITAYSQAMARAGQTNVHSRERAEAMLNTSQTPDQYIAVLDILQQETQAALKAAKATGHKESGTVRMIKNNQEYDIPEDKAEAAKKAGYEVK